MHLAEADRIVRAWGKECVDGIVRKDDGQYAFNVWPNIPVLLPVVISDAIHNLRAALDYLVSELALLDSGGKAQDGTQFLIDDVKSVAGKPNAGFDGRKGRYLKGLSPKHIDAIETLQPYNGVQWTETLRDISNPDKHRHLSVLTKENRELMVRTTISPEGRFEHDSFYIDSEDEIVFRRFDVEVDVHETIAVTLPKRGETAIMPTLRDLQLEVCRVLEAFKPEF